MKKKIIAATTLILLVHFLNNAVFSQTKDKKFTPKNILLSGRGGLSIANINASNTDGFRFTSTLGYMLGVYGEYRKQSKFGWLGGLQYSVKGATIKPEVTVLYDHITYNLSYVDLVLGGVYYPTSKLRFEGALIPAFKVAEDISYSAAYGIINGSSEAHDINSFDAGVMAGISYAFNKFTLGTNYTYGLVKIDKETSGTFSGLSNRVFTVSLNYNLNL